ncbi:MAG: YSC84-related protein [Verrucomicrobiota bacterium]|jgi:lipid-binding SYLF domain-containing protein
MNTIRSFNYWAIALVAGICIATFNQAEAAKFGFGKKKDKPSMEEQIKATIERFKEKDPSLEKRFKESVGYAIFPKVYKGGIGIGGAIGDGQVIEKGKHVGDTSLKQATIGFQLGGQAYSEVIFFHDQEALDTFKSGNFEFGAQVSAVAANAGASDDASFDQGMMVFTVEIGGLMYEATVGGQKFSYKEAK